MSTQSVTEKPAQNTEPRLGLALAVIATTQLMLVLDGTIMNVALPSIRGELRLAESDLSWVLTSYALAWGGLLLAGGRAGDLFGRKRVFRIGLVVFMCASLAGGFAVDGPTLIAARVAQGIGAALTAPAALSLLASTFPAGAARAKALGVYGAMGGLGAVVGLLLGGSLTEYLGWRWVLFVNVPVAVAVLVGTAVLVDGTRERGRIDLAGATLATLGVGSLIYAVNRAGSAGWTDTGTLGIGVLAAGLLVAFLVTQRRGAAPMIPPRVLADRGRLGAYAVNLLMGAGMLATFYFLTLYLQSILGFQPMLTGVAYLPFAIGIGIGSGWLGPKLLVATSERAVTTIGMVLAAAGMAWFGLLTPDSHPAVVLLPAQLVAGVGLGLAYVAATIAGVRGVVAQDTGIASGIINTAQQLGGALGLAALATIAVTVTRSAGTASAAALTAGYSAGFLVGGGLYLVAAAVALLTLRR